MTGRLFAGLVAVACGAAVAALIGLPDPPPAEPTVEISTEVLLDAATIELRGYGPDGTPGEFLYDCAHDGDRLVCTQRGTDG